MSQDHNGSRGGARGTEPSEGGAFVKYGSTPGQLEGMPMGDVSAVVSSPPYASGTVHSGNGIDPDKLTGNKPGRNSQAFAEGYGDSAGQLSTLRAGSVDSVVSSPPYAESLKGDNSERETAADSRAKRLTEGGSLGASLRHSGYGGPGNLGNLPSGEVEAVVTSPPYEGTDIAAKRTGTSYGDDFQRTGKSPRALDEMECEQYGQANGQLGGQVGETFWSAARDIVNECHAILKPGGYAAFVVKAFVRNKQIVDFPGDWRRLCEACGFVCVKEAHAMLVKEQRHPDLFGGDDHVKTTARKSFFRRLYERRFPENSIDYEVVLFFRKPV